MTRIKVLSFIVVSCFIFVGCNKPKKQEITESEKASVSGEQKKEERLSTPPQPEPARAKEEAIPHARDKDFSSGSSFQDKSWREMETALGGPVRTSQDAINAAFHKAGWEKGQHPTQKQDVVAYQQALLWGYSVDRVISKGRNAPFTKSDLADGPIPPPKVTDQQGLAAERTPKISVAHKEVSKHRQKKSEKPLQPLAPSSNQEQATLRIKPTLDRVEDNINLATSEFPTLERLAQDKTTLRRMKKEPLEQLIQNLNGLLDEASVTLETAQAEIKKLEAAPQPQ